MKTILKGSLIDLKNNIFHYLSICFFVLFSIIIFSSMISTSYQLYFSIQQIDNLSKKYDYSINVNNLSLLNKNLNDFKSNPWGYNFEKNIFDNFGLKITKTTSLQELNNDLTKSFCYYDLSSNSFKFENKSNDNNFTPSQIQQKNIVNLYLNYFETNFLKKSKINQSEKKLNYILNLNDSGFLQYLLNEFNNVFNSEFIKSNTIQNVNLSFVHSFFYTKKINNNLNFFKVELANNDINSYNFQIINNNNIEKINGIETQKLLKNNFLIRNRSFIIKNNLTSKFTLNDHQALFARQYIEYNDFYNNSLIPIANNYQVKIDGYASSENNIYPQTQAINIADSKINHQYLKKGSFIFVNLNLYYYLKQKYDPSLTDNEKILINFTNFKNQKNSEATNYFYSQNHGLFKILFNNYANTLDLFSASHSGWIKNNVQTILVIQVSVAFVVLFAILMTLFFFLKRYVDAQKQKIGFLKSLGVKNSKLSFIYSMPLAIIIVISSWLGYFFGIFLQIYFSNLFIFSIGTSLTPIFFGYYIFVALFFVLPIFFIFITYFINIRNLNKNIITLIYDYKVNKNIKIQRHKIPLREKIKFNNVSFNIKLSFSFLRNTFWKFLFTMGVFTLTIFLFFFEYSTNVYNDNFQDKSYNYVNSKVKTKQAFNVDQIINSFAHKNITFNFETEKNALNNLKPLDFGTNKTFVIKEPEQAVVDLFLGEGFFNQQDFIQKDNPVFGPLVNFFYLNQNNYISGSDTKKILNAQIKNPFSTEHENMLFWDFVSKYKKPLIKDIKSKSYLLPNINISDKKLNFIFNLANELKKYQKISDNNYPNIYLGNNFVYDSENETCFIQKQIKWNSQNTNSIHQFVPNLNLISVSKNQLNKFWNLKFSSDNLTTNLNTFWNNNKYQTWSQYHSHPLGVFISQRAKKANNFYEDETISLPTKLFNNYVNVKYKILGFINNDISSANFYVSYQNLNNYIISYAKQKFQINPSLIKNYANEIMVKYDKNYPFFISQFRNIDIFSNVGVYKHNSKSNLNCFANGISNILTNNSLTTISSFSNIVSYKLLSVINSVGTANVNKMLDVIEVFTAFAIFFTLFLLVRIIFDQHNRIILILKASGYSSKKLCYSILGFYFVFMVINVVIAWAISKAFWTILSNYIFSTSGVYFPIFFSWQTLLIIGFCVLLMMILLFYFGYKFINKKSISSISLSQT